MKAWLSLVLLAAPAAAVEVKSLPESAVVAPLGAATPVAPALPGAPTSLTAAAAAPKGVEAAAAVEPPALPVAAAAPAPAAAAPSATARPESRVARAETTGSAPHEDAARELVRRLMREGRAEREQQAQLDQAFDGTASRAELFPAAVEPGAVQQTRHGAYTLASSTARRAGKNDVLLERWEGPGGGYWVQRKRGPEAYEIREWRGPHKPAAFGPDGSPLPAAAYAEFWLSPGGALSSNIETAAGPRRAAAAFINAKAEFRGALGWFGARVRTIKGSWSFGDNIEAFNRLTGEGKTPEQAARLTWTGERAGEAGFTRVEFPEDGREELAQRRPGGYGRMTVLFLKP